MRRRLRPSSTCVLVALLACSQADVEIGATAPVERGRIERIVVATGTVEPEREVEVRPRIPGIIEKIHVRPGDDVEAGTLLVEIERQLLETQVAEAEAALKEAEISARYAARSFDRAGRLQETGVSSDSELDDASSRVEGARAGVARARARLANLSTQLSYAEVRAPSAGRVLDVHIEEGSAVSPVTAVTGGTLLLTLAGTDILYLEGLVDENEIARVQVGQRARLRTEAYSDREFDAVVSKIAPLGQRVQNVTYFEVELEITDPDADVLRPRMSGDAEIVTEVVDDAIVIPETALRYRGERIFVNTVVGEDPPEITERDVEVGIVDDTRVQVLSGLSGSEIVQLQ